MCLGSKIQNLSWHKSVQWSQNNLFQLRSMTVFCPCEIATAMPKPEEMLLVGDIQGTPKWHNTGKAILAAMYVKNFCSLLLLTIAKAPWTVLASLSKTEFETILLRLSHMKLYKWSWSRAHLTWPLENTPVNSFSWIQIMFCFCVQNKTKQKNSGKNYLRFQWQFTAIFAATSKISIHPKKQRTEGWLLYVWCDAHVSTSHH